MTVHALSSLVGHCTKSNKSIKYGRLGFRNKERGMKMTSHCDMLREERGKDVDNYKEDLPSTHHVK